MQTVKFIKMQGIGNDYVFVDQSKASTPVQPNTEWIRQIADRHFGVGADGFVLIEKSNKAAARMLMFNADGSHSVMCGNALRCIGLYIFEQTGQLEFNLQSEIGLHAVRILEGVQGQGHASIEINQGPPIFAADLIPFRQAGTEPITDIKIQLKDGSSYRATILSMGNPHCVIFVDDADAIDLQKVGPQIENHPYFPERTNVEFVSLHSSSTGDGLYQRTWERGSAETLACGSGACAVAVAAVLAGHFKKIVPIQLRGGTLELEWNGPGSDVLLRGPARLVFEGSYPAPGNP